ncbi:YbaB/EbfC family nucleoid-associated protein [Carnobacteriaceae bacterium zg-ZUI78]|uniref:YbaB/EbfC family nucleoid-associated protein n=1 Tax=Granulicatella sp. zg-84 TaxID=2678503 RepID=UPI0013C1EBAC|nr:YbaB/EbfC family nucleoid-associated protein [Granulicatella sp. zg-84]MBS4749838.1 YbaB/EbfC family nucleoid-associated protein [Carnobacteriaceae bacterium zg-ZUI78]NEW66222.1 YbaB/EbfC family nucleoid-associated protein [Granulicatella sp. zg-84]QMI85936.1 YbaB/EbfC family nucleoid-associated protein [Carnobacteriaceae bacterium zg-84]
MMKNMGNMQGMMKQVQKLQKEMEQAQEYLNTQEFVGSSVNDFVKVSLNGKRDVLDVTIAREVVDPDDIEMLQDLMVAAIADALKKVEDRTNEVMGRYTKGLPF